MAVFQVNRKNTDTYQNCEQIKEKFYIWAQNEREAHIKANKIIMKQGKFLCRECFKKWLWRRQEKYQKRSVVYILLQETEWLFEALERLLWYEYEC